MHEVRFIFLYQTGRYKVRVPKDVKTSCNLRSHSRCFVIPVIYGVRFRLKGVSRYRAAGEGGGGRMWVNTRAERAGVSRRYRERIRIESRRRGERPVVGAGNRAGASGKRILLNVARRD